MKNYRFAVVIEHDEEGYFAFCPEFQGCYTQGESYEEVLENMKDAIRLHVEDRRRAARRFLVSIPSASPPWKWQYDGKTTQDHSG